MKRFLPKSINNPQGFTLVELLVVVSIIAILSVIGVAVFGNIQVRARDARRKADVDAIGKAYEAKYDPDAQPNLAYSAPAGTDFQSGIIPTPPEKNGTYTYIAANGSTSTTPITGSTYKVCATLEGGNAGCTASTQPKCYCVSAAQGGPATGISTCSTLDGGSQTTCKINAARNPTSGPIYINCPATATPLTCTGTSTTQGNFTYFSQPSGGTADPAQISIFGASASDTQGTVTLRTVTVGTHQP